MAKLKKQILGKVSGKLGDLVFRNRYSTNYLSMLPTSYSVPSDPDSIIRRQVFTFNAKLASVMNRKSELKYIFNIKKPSGSTTFNYIVRTIYPFTTFDNFTSQISITPFHTFNIQQNDFNLSRDYLIIVLNRIGNNTIINPNIESHVKIVAILSLSSPNNSNSDSYIIYSLSSDPQPLNLNDSITFRIDFPENLIFEFNNYNTKTVAYTLLTMNNENKIHNYSRTIFNQINK